MIKFNINYFSDKVSAGNFRKMYFLPHKNDPKQLNFRYTEIFKHHIFPLILKWAKLF